MPYISDGEHIYSRYSTKGQELQEAENKAHTERMKSDPEYRAGHDAVVNATGFIVLVGMFLMAGLISHCVWKLSRIKREYHKSRQGKI